jgi:hypothetical protein
MNKINHTNSVNNKTSACKGKQVHCIRSGTKALLVALAMLGTFEGVSGMKYYCPSEEEKETDETVIKTLKENKDLTSIDLSNRGTVTTKMITAIVKHCQKVESLDFTDCSFDDINDLEQLVNCEQLEELTLEGCGDDVTDDIISSIIEGDNKLLPKCPLRVLNLKGCGKIGDGLMDDICEYCKKIESVNVLGCNVTIDGIKALTKRTPNYLNSLKFEQKLSDPEDNSNADIKKVEKLKKKLESDYNLTEIKWDGAEDEDIDKLEKKMPGIFSNVISSNEN